MKYALAGDDTTSTIRNTLVAILGVVLCGTAAYADKLHPIGYIVRTHCHILEDTAGTTRPRTLHFNRLGGNFFGKGDIVEIMDTYKGWRYAVGPSPTGNGDSVGWVTRRVLGSCVSRDSNLN
jgi:hypothetical protein